jgi:hypothetical protein
VQGSRGGGGCGRRAGGMRRILLLLRRCPLVAVARLMASCGHNGQTGAASLVCVVRCRTLRIA